MMIYYLNYIHSNCHGASNLLTNLIVINQNQIYQIDILYIISFKQIQVFTVLIYNSKGMNLFLCLKSFSYIF